MKNKYFFIPQIQTLGIAVTVGLALSSCAVQEASSLDQDQGSTSMPGAEKSGQTCSLLIALPSWQLQAGETLWLVVARRETATTSTHLNRRDLGRAGLSQVVDLSVPIGSFHIRVNPGTANSTDATRGVSTEFECVSGSSPFNLELDAI